MHQPEKPQSPPAQRVVQPVWYSVVVCTSGAEGAGLRPAEASAVLLTLHGSRGSSAKVKLPSQAGDFERGQEDVFRVQLPPVGCLEKLGVGLSCANEQAAWLLEQVEVTEEATGGPGRLFGWERVGWVRVVRPAVVWPKLAPT
jgi:hypothetical protein